MVCLDQAELLRHRCQDRREDLIKAHLAGRTTVSFVDGNSDGSTQCTDLARNRSEIVIVGHHHEVDRLHTCPMRKADRFDDRLITDLALRSCPICWI